MRSGDYSNNHKSKGNGPGAVKNADMKHGTRKIAVIAPRYGLVGGFEKFSQELTERLALNPSYEIHVFADKWEKSSRRIIFHKVPIIKFPRFLKPLSFAWFVRRKLQGMDFDLIHSHERIFYADIFSVHGTPHPIWVKEVRKKSMGLFDMAVAWVEKSMIKGGSCRKFLPVSTITGETLLRQFAVDPSRVEIVHPGVDIERFDKHKQKSRHTIRRQLGIKEGDIVVSFVGMNFEVKGLAELIHAIAKVKSEYPVENVKLLVAGKGDYKKYKNLAVSTGIGNDIIFAGVLRDGIEDVYLASDIFSMLSEFDTFGLAVLEAMASSLPVIISNRVGARDIVKEGVSGFVVERKNIHQIASKIVFLLDAANREKFAKEARLTALQHSWESVADRMTDIYEEILMNRNREDD